MSLETFTRGYLAAAFYTSTNESNQEPLDCNFSVPDIGDAKRIEMKADACKFYLMFAEAWRGAWIEFVKECDVAPGDEDQQAGYDFWMTRNGHGVGFWEDADWEAETGKKLTAGAEAFGEAYLDEQDMKED